MYRWVIAGMLCASVAGCGTTPDPVEAQVHTLPPAAPAAAPSPSPSAAPRPVTYPAHGAAKWLIAPGQQGPAAGTGGRLMRYRVAVERDIRNLSTPAFADAVTATLADPRSWIGGGSLRLRRVGPGQPYDFTIFLATPDTRDRLCGDVADGYTSCRNGNAVVLNVARWVKGVPGYAAGLAVYRQYMVNHEVGHRLGHGHELCPGAGRPAPVMQQQTLGMHGCVPNAWPYPKGTIYHGPSGQYDDQPPGRDAGRLS
ncbi:lipoprotein [Paractinoplanes deccanensis]|uniref:Lipoprotein n=1 Tax=Paractinoplanes deccanensis TaxID=113561 RepID=A0ABQ3YAJ7_9ACTN|nr:DUF3152 domain-containing protein [Actinoplanes deccanensis]GID77031.1 lipoprotein [Actinoplanes deccanensis]